MGMATTAVSASRRAHRCRGESRHKAMTTVSAIGKAAVSSAGAGSMGGIPT